MSIVSVDLARVHDLLDEQGSGPTEFRVLVDRLWPRGVKKERLRFDDWAKDAAPSADLRTAFHSGELDFEEFSGHYRRELEESAAAQALQERALEAGATRLLLLFAAKDTDHTHAHVLRDALIEAEE